ncbi:MAG TPA: hypothetical protein VLI45_09195 [Acidobacteriaceae bacterium]|nr:hypothetical protein [Acidobacteriaceae bacterium]
MITFPKLSRKPALKTQAKTLDPTLRDSYENGMESTRARYKRRRREWNVSIDFLTPADVTVLDNFVENLAVYGANSFTFPDNRDPKHPQSYVVRFSTLPAYADANNIEGEFRQNCTFAIREV